MGERTTTFASVRWGPLAFRLVPAVAEKPRTRGGKRERRSMGKLMSAIDAYDVPRSKGVSTEDAWKVAFERLHGQWIFVCSMADKVRGESFWVSKLDAQGNLLVEPNKWFQLEERMRLQLVEMVETAQRFGLAERMVAVTEARQVLVAQAVRDAAIDAGLGPEQVASLGNSLRKRLEAASG